MLDPSLGLLFFVVALIYLGYFIIVIVRTCKPLFGCTAYGNSRPMKVFRVFYGMIWVQMFLNSILYWVLFG